MEQHVGLIKLALVFALALGLLGYELYAVRKAIAADDAAKQPPPNQHPTAMPDDT